MGMYDTLYCDMELPIGDGKKRFFHPNSFQTKSLDRQLDFYRIDKDGKLWKEIVYDELSDKSEWERHYIDTEIIFWDWVKIGFVEYWGTWQLKVVKGLVDFDSVENLELEKLRG